MAQSARKAAVVRVDNAPPRALGSRRGRSNSVLPRYLRTGRPYPGATAGAYGPRARVIRVADPVGVVATCLLGHNFALRYPGASRCRRLRHGSVGEDKRVPASLSISCGYDLWNGEGDSQLCIMLLPPLQTGRLREAGFLPLPRLRTGRESFPSSSSSISKAV